jgi:hypothetical protein
MLEPNGGSSGRRTTSPAVGALSPRCDALSSTPDAAFPGSTGSSTSATHSLAPRTDARRQMTSDPKRRTGVSTALTHSLASQTVGWPLESSARSGHTGHSTSLTRYSARQTGDPTRRTGDPTRRTGNPTRRTIHPTRQTNHPARQTSHPALQTSNRPAGTRRWRVFSRLPPTSAVASSSAACHNSPANSRATCPATSPAK